MDKKELRDYQRSIVEIVKNSDKNQLICLPTGSGKTVIAGSLIKELEGPLVFIVPRLELLHQASEEFGKVDLIWSDKTSLTGKKCIVASKDSLLTQGSLIPENATLIIDEAHVSLEQSFNIVQKTKPRRVIGLTATPERMDGESLMKGSLKHQSLGIFDELVQKESVASLIDKGYLTPLKYFTRPIEGITSIVADGAGDELSDKQMVDIFDKNKIWGDIVASYEEYGKGRPALGFTNTIAMGEKVVALFQSKGYNFKIIHGGMSVAERQDLITRLRFHKIDGLVNAALLTYGFDCPPVSYAFSCRHIKSRPLWFQIVGRILRTFPGKDNTIFVDHGDSISEFVEPTCSLPILDPYIKWNSYGESKEEKSAKKKELKRIQETMSLISNLDPLPVQMVEVTQDNMWDRLIKILQKFQKENTVLGDLVQNLNTSHQKLSKENSELNKKLKASKGVKYMDSDQTFEFCKKSYPFIRGMIHDEYKLHKGYWTSTAEQRAEYEHSETIKALKEKFDKLSFLIDEHTFTNSTRWWKSHWKPRK